MFIQLSMGKLSGRINKLASNYTFQNQPVCFKITCESENELLNMNFQGKCAIKLVHGLPKLEPSRNMS